MAEIPYCAAPDPRLRTPRLSLPARACDTHAHLFGPPDRYPYQANRGYTPPDATDDSYLALHAALGITRGVLTQPSVYGIDNRRMLDAVARHRDRLRAVAAVDGAVSDGELARLDAAGVRGIRVNLVDKGGMPFASFAEVARMADRIAPLGWHLELLVHAHDYPDFAPVMRALPVDIVVGHLGYMPTSAGLDHPGFRSFLGLVAEGRCWVKLTAPYRITTQQTVPYDDVAPFARRLITTRPDRMLWGSDWPHVACKLPMPNDTDLLDLLGDWAPDAAIRQQILVDNPARLYGFA
jgi:predicted TIM-barrel fold metal-dependent hydrolase